MNFLVLFMQLLPIQVAQAELWFSSAFMFCTIRWNSMCPIRWWWGYVYRL